MRVGRFRIWLGGNCIRLGFWLLGFNDDRYEFAAFTLHYERPPSFLNELETECDSNQ